MEIFFSFVDFQTIARVLVRTAAIFIFAFFVLRLLGKRHLAHLTYLDLLLVIALGSAVGDVMIYEESTVQLLSSVIGITMVGILVKLFNELSLHNAAANSLIEGTARLVISNGKVIKDALAKENMSQADLVSMMRQKGFTAVAQIQKGFIEPDGELSLVRKRIKQKNKN